MTEDPKRAEKARRKARLQAALRENLKRRKAQARGRAERSGTDSASQERALPVTTEEQEAE